MAACPVKASSRWGSYQGSPTANGLALQFEGPAGQLRIRIAAQYGHASAPVTMTLTISRNGQTLFGPFPVFEDHGPEIEVLTPSVSIGGTISALLTCSDWTKGPFCQVYVQADREDDL